MIIKYKDKEYNIEFTIEYFKNIKQTFKNNEFYYFFKYISKIIQLDFNYEDIVKNKCLICNSNCNKKFCKKCFNTPKFFEYIKAQKLLKYGDENYCNKDKIKQTKLEKYGNANYNNMKKIEQTKLERFGNKKYNNLEKQKQTTFEKYGVTNVYQSEEIKDKIKKIKLEKYGNEKFVNPRKISKTKLNYDDTTKSKIKEKRKQTNLEKYAVENISQLKDIKQKVKNTNLEKYGVENVFQSKIIKDKIKQTNLEKYGSKYFSQQHIQNLNQLNEEYIRDNFINDKWFLIDEFVQYFGFKSLTTGYNYKNLFNILEPKKTLLIKEPLFLDTLEEILKVKIQRQFKIKNYKVDGFISFEDSKYLVTQGIIEKPKSIAIEFLGDYWHGFKNNDELNFLGIPFSEVYNSTFERFNDILLQKEVDEIWYLWENQFDDFMNSKDLNTLLRI